MKRRKSPPQPRPSSPWRWDIGGPITDFGDEHIEAGPSRPRVSTEVRARRLTKPRTMEKRVPPSSTPLPVASPSSASRGARRLTAALAFAAALPLAAAGPVPVPPLHGSETRTTPATYPTRISRKVHYQPEYIAPTTLPVFSTITVPETVLPYYLTQAADGKWRRAEGSWVLYGRQASAETTPPALATDSASLPVSASTFVVGTSLPTGWGVSNNRSAFYKTPLIVTAAVILAVFIVGILIFITLQRRKTSRRKKRRAARLRRKALAAEGLTEDSLNAANAAVAEQFQQRLAEFEKQHEAKRRAAMNGTAGVTTTSKKHHHSSVFVRSKVKVWRKTLHRRKARTKEVTLDANGKEIIPDGAYTSGFALGRQTSGMSYTTADSVSLPSSQSSISEVEIEDRQSRSPPPSGPTDSSDAGGNTASETLAASATNSDPSHSHTSHSPPSSPSEPSEPLAAAGPSMPPAYRPASVRSVQAGPSSSARPALDPIVSTPAVLTQEKVAAAGFYPAPATLEAEMAQAVSHRADAKAPLAPPPPEEEERRALHLATDDKRTLERLRLGASAPPVAREDGNDAGPSYDAAGPSAPHVELDEAGFEAFTAEESGPSQPSTSRAPAVGVPEPPARLRLRTHTPYENNMAPTDSSHLLPSAPPAVESVMSAPSAPPMAEDDDEPSAPSAPAFDGDDDDGLSYTSASAPSAPPLEHEDAPATSSGASATLDADDDLADSAARATAIADAAEETDATPGEADAALPASGAGDVAASLGLSGHRFLPRYTP